jgi:hypothetical protein
MPVEIREEQYGSLVRQLRSSNPSSTYVAPWLSDFCYLTFAFPSERVGLAFSKTYGTGRVFSRPEFRKWMGTYPYIGGLAELEPLPRPWIYLGWDYNPAVRTIDERLGILGLRYLDDPTRRARLMNHLTPSWIWSSDEVRLEPARSSGQYHAFEIVPARP